jgi:serine protease Do
MKRKTGFAALLAVVGVSIVFGMILGGRLNAPRVMLASGEGGAPFSFAPATAEARPAGVLDFSDIAESAIPAVVSVTNTSVRRGEEDDPRIPFRDDPFFRWFFGPQEPPQQRRPQQPERRIGFGSGFLISPDGYILTNNHVVEGATRLTVGLNSGERLDAEVIGSDPSIDLALIKIDAKGKTLPYLPLGDSDGLRVGQWVLAIGNPLDLDYTVTVGVVSAKGRRVPIGRTDAGIANFIQTDAAINFGNSGGPLLDAQGRVVGINTAINRSNLAEGIGFALPINEAKEAAEQLRATGRVSRGYIGIVMNPNPIGEEARDYYGLPDTHGVLVQEVTAGGPADQAGLERGDIIRKVEGDVVRNNTDMISKIASRRPGDKIRVEVFRPGRGRESAKTVTLTVTLAERDIEAIARSGVPGQPPAPQEEPPEAAKALGISVEALTPAARQRLRLGADVPGVLVSDVDVNSTAADAGIQAGMVITGANDRPVRGIADWNEVMGGLRPGTPVKLEIQTANASFYVFLRVPAE